MLRPLNRLVVARTPKDHSTLGAANLRNRILWLLTKGTAFLPGRHPDRKAGAPSARRDRRVRQGDDALATKNPNLGHIL